MNNSFFGKTMGNVRNYRDIKLVTTERRKETNQYQNQIINYKIFNRKCISNKNEKTQILINKPVYLGLSILNLSKTVMCELWFGCLKPKYSENVKLCQMDTDSVFVHVKTDEIYKDIAEDVEKRFDSSNFEIDRPLPKEKK